MNQIETKALLAVLSDSAVEYGYQMDQADEAAHELRKAAIDALTEGVSEDEILKELAYIDSRALEAYLR